MSILVSILICTRDRLPSLRYTMRSVGGLVVPQGLEAELVVVDNGSRDGTVEWVRQVRLPNMPVRVVEEPRPGTGYARTTALQAARGAILLFTDDDVVLPPEWIGTLCSPIVDGSADVVGGTSVLAPHLCRPWMNAFHFATLSTSTNTAPGVEGGMITISMAMDQRVLEQVPAFDPELGPGSRCGFLEDILFGWQLAEAGYRFLGVSESTVVHHPSDDRLSRPAFLRAARARGRSTSYVRYHWMHWGAEAFTHRRHAWQVWRHPYLVLIRRWLRLWGWRVRHPAVFWQREGIAYMEFALVNQLYQVLQYLAERRRPRNYEHRGLIKRRGILPDTPAPGHIRDSTAQESQPDRVV